MLKTWWVYDWYERMDYLKVVFIIKRQCSSDNNTESTVPFNSSKGLSGPIESFSSAFSTKVSNLLTRVDKLSTSPTRGPRFFTAVYVQCRSFAKHCSQGLPLEHFDFRCRHEIQADIRHGNTAQFLPMISARGEPWGDRILGKVQNLKFHHDEVPRTTSTNRSLDGPF